VSSRRENLRRSHRTPRGGKKLANDLGEELCALLIGGKIGGLGQEAIAYGADKVYVAEDSLLDHYHSDAYTLVSTNLCRKVLPSVMLLGHTDAGCDLAPRLNGRLGVDWLWTPWRYPLTRRPSSWSRPDLSLAERPRQHGVKGCPASDGYGKTENSTAGRAQ